MCIRDSDYHDELVAIIEQQRLEQLVVDNCELLVDRSGSAVTITYLLDGAGDQITIDGETHLVSEAGLYWAAVTEHRAGVHDPLGTLIVANSTNAELPLKSIDVLQIAPALLAMLDLAPLPHHVDPTIRLG